MDIPSGISADTGTILGAAVKADLTVTFGYRKAGLCFYPGAACAGKIILADVGIYRDKNTVPKPEISACTREELRALKRNPEGNKGTFGKIFLVAGSRDIFGAAYLSGYAAMKTGAGMIKICTAKENRDMFVQRYRSVGPDDYANISYTSGTTADPKGILLTHRNYTANVEQAQSVIGVTPEDRMLIILPLDHCFAHVAGFYTMMSYGASIGTVPPGRTPMEALRNIPMSIKELQPTVMLSVPALAKNFKKNIESGIKAKGPKVEKLYNFALENAVRYNKEGYNKGGIDFWRKPLVSLFDRLIFKNVREALGGKMKFFVGGGALLDIDLQRYYYAIGIPMYQGYGLSEATPIISANAPAKHILGSSGKVVSPMEIKILDADGRELPYGEKGEIVIKGENVMAGYWKNPKATAETVVDGWLHTGDMGYMRDAEMLYVVGRFKSLLISADGEKYSPEGIEESLVENSMYIDQVVLHNSQDPYTIALLVPNKEALKSYVKGISPELDPASDEAKRLMLVKLQEEIDSYRKGGKNHGAFPERWLPAAVCVLPEPFTEQNRMVNSTMKIVRGKVEEAYRDRMAFAYTPEGKDIVNPQNLSSL